MAPPGPVRAFLSYAHEDHAWRDAVLKHIGWLSHSHQLDTFDDRELKPGELWDERIGRELERADIVIALISPDFVFSRYCSVDELLRAIQRQRDGSADLVPIVCDHVDLGALPLAAHQCLPQDEQNDLKPLVDWPNPNLPLAKCAAKIRALVEARRPPPAAEPQPVPPPPTPPVAATPNLAARLAFWGAAKLAGLVGPAARWAPRHADDDPPAITRPHGAGPHPRATGDRRFAAARPPDRPADRSRPARRAGYSTTRRNRSPSSAPAASARASSPSLPCMTRACVARFGDRRLFVRLEDVRDEAGIYRAIARELGVDPDVRPIAAVAAALRGSPALLVLDNAETPWDADLQVPSKPSRGWRAAERRPRRLAARLRAAGRRRLAPDDLLEPLPVDPARELFIAIAGDALRRRPPTSLPCSPASTACRSRSSLSPTAPRPSPTPPPSCAVGTRSSSPSSAAVRAAARTSTLPSRLPFHSPARA